MLNIYLKDGRAVKVRSIIFCVLIILAIFIGLIYLYNYLSYVNLTVTTNSSNNIITVVKVSSYDQTKNSNSPATQNLHNGQTVKLHTGLYDITVSNAAFSEQQIVNLKSGQNKKEVIDLNSTTALEPVSSLGLLDPIESSSQILFINSLTKNLSEFNSQSQLQVLDNSHQFANIQWANPSFGIGLDNSGNFYGITNGSISSIELPVVYIHYGLVQFAVTPNKTIYIAAKGGVYKGSIGQSFSKIFSTNAPVSLISATSNSVAIFSGTNEDNQSSSNDSTSQLTILTNQNNKYQIKNIDANDISWSESGKYLAGAVNGQVVIWNNQLKQVATIPNNGASSLVWLNNSDLIYTQSNKIWIYNLQAQKASILGQATNNQNVTGLSLSTDDSYLYVSVENQQSIYGLDRIGLNNQTVSNSNLLDSLSLLLPNTLSGCSLDFISFHSTNPSLIIQSPVSAQQTCTQQAQSYLGGYSVVSSSLGIQFIPN